MALTHKQPRPDLLTLQPALATRPNVRKSARTGFPNRVPTAPFTYGATYGAVGPTLKCGHFVDLTV